MNANDRQVGGSHYRAAYQHWDLVHDTGMGYFPAQITRYIARHQKKHGLQDVEKAGHYLEKYTELLGSTYILAGADYARRMAYVAQFFAANPHLGLVEREIITLLVGDLDAAVLEAVRLGISWLVEQYNKGSTP